MDADDKSHRTPLLLDSTLAWLMGVLVGIVCLIRRETVLPHAGAILQCLAAVWIGLFVNSTLQFVQNRFRNPNQKSIRKDGFVFTVKKEPTPFVLDSSLAWLMGLLVGTITLFGREIILPHAGTFVRSLAVVLNTFFVSSTLDIVQNHYRYTPTRDVVEKDGSVTTVDIERPPPFLDSSYAFPLGLLVGIVTLFARDVIVPHGEEGIQCLSSVFSALFAGGLIAFVQSRLYPSFYG